MQGAQTLSDDSYVCYYEETKDAAQRSSWTFYEAITIETSFQCPYPLQSPPEAVQTVFPQP